MAYINGNYDFLIALKGDKGDPATGAPVVQNTGTDEEAVMSQKAVTDELNAVKNTLTNYENEIKFNNGTNIFDPLNIEQGLFDYTTGEKKSSTAVNQPYRSAKKIYLENDGQYKLQVFAESAFTAGTIYIWMYDESGSFLKYTSRNIATDGCIWFETNQTEGTCRYINFSLHNCEPNIKDIIKDINIMISMSTVAEGADPKFIPYGVESVEIPKIIIPNAEKRQRYKFNGKMLNVGYSTINFTPINTLENFLSVWKCGFNACKGDVRITSDNKLIMCHDAGFTFDDDGYIVEAYDSTNCSVIREMTYEECMSKEYAPKSKYMGYHAKVADFEGYISICKEKGMIPLITIRDEYIDEILTVMLPIIEKYELTYDCIINSMTYETLKKLRKVDKEIFATYTLSSGTAATITDVDKCIALGNCALCLFTEPSNGDTTITNSQSAIDYAKSVGVPLMDAQVSTVARYKELTKKGFSGFHITKPILDYSFIDITLSVSNSDSGVTVTDSSGYADRYTATAVLNGDTIELSEISHKGNTLPFSDAVLNLWLALLPSRITVTDYAGNIIPSLVSGTKIVIKTADIGTYKVVVSI